MILGVAELAAAFGCSQESVRLWSINDGLPCLRRGSPGVEARYPLPECIAWLVARERAKEAENPTGRRAEWVAVKIDRERLKLAEEAGKLVAVDGVRSAAALVGRRVRDSLLTIPDKLAPVIAAETDQARCWSLLDAEIRSALTALADWEQAPIVGPHKA